MKRLGRRKSVNNKRRMIYFSLFFVFLFISTGSEWWTVSPIGFGYSGSYVRYLETDGSLEVPISNNIGGYRPVISLLSLNRIISGSGSETDPWVIE